MLYGSEYIISLSHREKIYCNHPAFLLLISIKGSRGREDAQPSLPWRFEAFAIHCFFFALFPFMLFQLTRMQKMMAQTALPGIVLWILATVLFMILYPNMLFHRKSFYSILEDLCKFFPYCFVQISRNDSFHTLCPY